MLGGQLLSYQLATLLSSLVAHWRIKPQALWQFLCGDLSKDGVGLRPGLVTTRVWLLDFLCSSTQLYMLLSPYLGLIYFLYLNLYYLVDDASMGWGSLMQTKHIFVLIHYRNNGEVGTLKHIKAHW